MKNKEIKLPSGCTPEMEKNWKSEFGERKVKRRIIVLTDEGKEYIFGNDFTIEDIDWVGTQATVQEQAALCGIENTDNLKKLEAYLKKALNSVRIIHYLAPYRAETKIQLLNWINIHPKEVNAKSSLALTKAVVNQRNYKYEEEMLILTEL